jgi:glycosyltransferase involved in cell wall biosynthesis
MYNSYLFSIVTSCYNSDKFILDTYNSILNQSYTNWEWIIVNDNSDDNSLNILLQISKNDKRVIILNNSFNCGSAFSRNRGIEIAKGSYLSFIDSDDIWLPNYIENVLNFMTCNDFDFVFTSYERRDETLEINYGIFKVPNKISFYELLKSCPISCLTACINLNKLPKLYMPNYKSRQDYALWLNYLKLTQYAYGLNESLAVYRIRRNSLSRNKFKSAIYQFLIYYDFLNFNFIKSLYFFSHWFFNGIFKYKFKKYI